MQITEMMQNAMHILMNGLVRWSKTPISPSKNILRLSYVVKCLRARDCAQQSGIVKVS